MMNTSKLKGWITLLGEMKGRNVNLGIWEEGSIKSMLISFHPL